MKTEMRREVSVFEFLTVGVDMGLEGRNGIREFCVLNSSEENATASPIIIMKVELGLEAEV